MTRVIWLTFFGEYRGQGTPHESGPRITVPLIILAVAAVFAGFLNVPEGLPILGSRIGLTFERWVEPAGIRSFPAISHGVPSFSLAIFATLVGLGAGVVVYIYYKQLYARDRRATEVTNGLRSKSRVASVGYNFLAEKYYLDHLYTNTIARFVRVPLSNSAYWFNQNVIDKIIDTVGTSAVAIGRFIYRYIDQGAIDGTVNSSGLSALSSGQILRRVQSGQIRQYATLMFGAAALLAAVFIVAV